MEKSTSRSFVDSEFWSNQFEILQREILLDAYLDVKRSTFQVIFNISLKAVFEVKISMTTTSGISSKF